MLNRKQIRAIKDAIIAQQQQLNPLPFNPRTVTVKFARDAPNTPDSSTSAPAQDNTLYFLVAEPVKAIKVTRGEGSAYADSHNDK